MARLVTHHDPYHVHKTLGLAALLHFLLRIACFFWTGSAFATGEPLWLTSAGVLLHGVLSFSSLLLPLPTKRNFSAPMIWPEFRLHSIIFASRHVLCTLLTLNHAWPTNLYAHALAKLTVVIGTVKAAEYVTERFGDKANRTTNSMPYPASISQEEQLAIKREYARAQFGATVGACLPDPTIAFLPLLPIQIAPFLMTLVRKGKIGAISYHAVYVFSLWIVWVALALILWRRQENDTTFFLFASAVAPIKLRLDYGWNKTFIWCLHNFLAFIVFPLFLARPLSKLEPYAHWGSLAIVIKAACQVQVYSTVWTHWLAPTKADAEGKDSECNGSRHHGWGRVLLRFTASSSTSRFRRG
mmetsp:Transcript_38714/g.93977  ORF Transcript_38714/g.93977 Transcript_38714/m.93977 type:complete len:356 (+) Transcript_38714:45-1112(+)